MVGEISTPVWFRHDGDWKHGWGTLNNGNLTIWMHTLMTDPKVRSVIFDGFGHATVRHDQSHSDLPSHRTSATRYYDEISEHV